MTTTHDERKPADVAVLQQQEGPVLLAEANSRTFGARLLVACLFWLLCLTLTAAGHRLYKATVSVDREVSSDRYQAGGAPMVWVGHGTVKDAYERLAESETFSNGTQLYAQPNSTFWLAAVLGFTFLAAVMAWSGQWVANNGIQSLIGLFAGHFLWLGAVEFGLDAVGRRLGLAGTLEVVGGRIVGTHGGGVLIQMSVVFLLPVLVGWTMHESNRCAMLQWIRRRVPLTRSVVASGRVENYAARTAIQYFTTVWFCYVGVLWLADPMLGMVGGYALLAVMWAIFAATPYMIWRTTCQRGTGQALRYSVSGAIVAWTGIEIAAAMRFFDEPWLSTSTASGLILLGLTIGLTAMGMFALRRVATRPLPLRSQGSLLVVIALACLGGCIDATNREPLTAAQIGRQLRDYDERILPPDAKATDGMLHALASNSPEMAAQAAVAFGKSKKVTPVVRKQLEAIALSDESRLSQLAALQALARLGLLKAATQAVIDDLADDEAWGPLVASFEQ